jgi:hypothetical protein
MRGRHQREPTCLPRGAKHMLGDLRRGLTEEASCNELRLLVILPLPPPQRPRHPSEPPVERHLLLGEQPV